MESLCGVLANHQGIRDTAHLENLLTTAAHSPAFTGTIIFAKYPLKRQFGLRECEIPTGDMFPQVAVPFETSSGTNASMAPPIYYCGHGRLKSSHRSCCTRCDCNRNGGCVHKTELVECALYLHIVPVLARTKVCASSQKDPIAAPFSKRGCSDVLVPEMMKCP